MAKKSTKKSMPPAKTSKKKKTNVGLKASRFSPLSLRFGLSKRKKVNKGMLAGIILLLAVIGGYVIYSSQAATDTVTGEALIQYYNINSERTNLNLGALQISRCLSTTASYWAKQMGTNQGLRHMTAADKEVMRQATGCSVTNYTFGENIGTGGDSPGLFRAFMNSPGHKANILLPQYTHMGVGSYRNSQGTLWIAQHYIVTSSSIDTLTVSYWNLNKGKASFRRGNKKPVSLNAKRGSTVARYATVTNSGPLTANFTVYIDSDHYAKGSPNKPVSSAQLDRSVQAKAKGGVYNWNKNFTIPANAPIGDKYCHTLYYSSPTGNGGWGHTNRSCVTVVK